MENYKRQKEKDYKEKLQKMKDERKKKEDQS